MTLRPQKETNAPATNRGRIVYIEFICTHNTPLPPNNLLQPNIVLNNFVRNHDIYGQFL